MTDPQVRQLAEQLAKIFGFNCKPEDNCAECPCHIEEAAEFLAAFASHTRREALREAAEIADKLAEQNDVPDNEWVGDEDDDNRLSRQIEARTIAAAIRVIT